MKHKFISYCWQDKQFVSDLASALENSGIRIFRDIQGIIPGSVIKEKVDEALLSSNVFILVASPSSLASKWVRYETKKALALEKQGRLRVLVLKYKECDLNTFIPEYSGRLQVYFNGNMIETVKDLIRSIQPDIAPQFGVHRVVEFKGSGGKADFLFRESASLPYYTLNFTIPGKSSYAGFFWEPVSALFMKDYTVLEWEMQSKMTGGEYQMKIEMEHDELKTLIPFTGKEEWEKQHVSFKSILMKEKINILERVTVAMDNTNKKSGQDEYSLSIRSIKLI